MRLQKEQLMETTNKNSIKLRENAVEAVKSDLHHKICSIEPSSNANNVVCNLSLTH